MLAHNWSNLAVAKVLGASMDNSQTTMQLDSLTGLPAYPYIMILERDTASIEAVSVTSLASGTTVNVTRGFGDTSPVAHTAPCPVIHAVPAEFYTDVLADIATNAGNIATNAAAIATLTADAGLKVKKLAARNTTVSIANTETRVVGVTMPTGTLATGTVIEFETAGLLTNTTTASTSVWRIRVGPTSLGANIVASWSVALGTTARTNAPFTVQGKLVVLSATTAIGIITVVVNGVPAIPAAAVTTMVTSPVTIATNANQEVELSVISGAASTTWNNLVSYMELVAA